MPDTSANNPPSRPLREAQTNAYGQGSNLLDTEATAGMPAEAENLNPPPTQIANHHTIPHNGIYQVPDRPGLGHELNPDYLAAGPYQSLIDRHS